MQGAAGRNARAGGNLADYLVEQGLITPADVGRALEIQRQHHNKRFVDILVEAGLVAPEVLLEAFPKLGVFNAPFDPAASRFADSYVHERFEEGESIFKEGELGLKAYVLVSGSVRILHSAADSYLLAVVSPGEIFGEMALLDGGHRSATAEAAEPSEVMVLNRGEFLAQLRAKPDIALEVINLLARRLRSADDLIALLSDPVPDLS
ncbi:MAG: Crp/Fnr family transcriptional regulator [Candidatus Sericytochromatia bacterium]|nr:Crp/Fnr family transcriptional regulator [Candidatus Tanganyikabacteria bacterium]